VLLIVYTLKIKVIEITFSFENLKGSLL